MLDALLAALALQATTPPPSPLTHGDLGGLPQNPFAAPIAAGALAPRVVRLNLNFPGQTWQEEVVVALPAVLAAPTPVLTIFHGYGERPEHVLANTPLVREAVAAGWMVVIPMGAHPYHYGIEYAQANIERVYEVLGQLVPLDLDRMVAVGFSMGGGAAASYAARHLDPSHVRYAAVVDHTGSSSLRHTYHLTNDTNLFRSPLMFGGTPEERSFEYLRSSTVDLDPFTGALDFSSDLARNLTHVAMRHCFATHDPVAALVEQTEALHGVLTRRKGATALDEVASSAHSWRTLDTDAVLAFLASARLRVPRADEVVRTIADRDGRWHHFGVTQAAPRAFTPFTWLAQKAANRLIVIDAENLAAIDVDLADVELDGARALHVVLHARDASRVHVALRGLAAPPAAVTRNGVASADWTWRAADRTLVLEERDPRNWGSWTIAP